MQEVSVLTNASNLKTQHQSAKRHPNDKNKASHERKFTVGKSSNSGMSQNTGAKPHGGKFNKSAHAAAPHAKSSFHGKLSSKPNADGSQPPVRAHDTATSAALHKNGTQNKDSAQNKNSSQNQSNTQKVEHKSNDKPFAFKPRSSSLGKIGRSNNFDGSNNLGGFSSSSSSPVGFARSEKRSQRVKYDAPMSVGRVFNKAIAGDQPVPGLAAGVVNTESQRSSFSHNSHGKAKSGKERQARHQGTHLRVAVGSQSRAAAAKVLEAVAQGRSLSEAFPVFCQPLDERDTAFVKEIVFGTLRQRRILMNTMLPLVEHKLNEKHRIVHFLIISAMYQLVFLQSPPHAVVSATVSACGECGQKSYASMVNAVLRRFLRENMQLAHSDSLAVEYSFPDWLCDRITNTYQDKAAFVLEQSNAKPPLILRVENSKLTTQDFLQKLAAHEIGASLVAPELSNSAVILENALNVSEIPGFDEGVCSVQDLSAQLAAPLLELGNEPLRVLDCCCAPGGKTAHILDLNPQCKVTALDVEYPRLQQTKSTLERLGRNAELQVMDAQDLSSLKGEFDRILVDAPCSGTGVIRRHPDIKWLRRQKDIENLAAIQAKILDAAFAKLKKGGILLYTTCSILPEENDQQITSFLQRHTDAQLKPFTLGGQTYQTWQRLPGEQNGDGFFYARITKL